MKNTWYCLGCRKPIADAEAGYHGCYNACEHPLITKCEALELAMSLLEFAGWQPMETAPRGEDVLLLDVDGNVQSAVRNRNEENGAWLGVEKYLDCSTLVGWLPLPEIEEVE